MIYTCSTSRRDGARDMSMGALTDKQDLALELSNRCFFSRVKVAKHFEKLSRVPGEQPPASSPAWHNA